LKSLWNVCRSILGWVFPIFGNLRKLRPSEVQLRWIIHAVLVTGILVGLSFLNRYVEHWLPTANWFVRKTWLPLLFVMVYALLWLGWWIWQLLGPAEESSQFPDIDAAWEEAMQTLAQAQLDLTRLPLFLVLGKPDGGEEIFFQTASSAGAAVFSLSKFAPKRSDSPLRVYVGTESVFVTCPGASLLGAQAEFLNTDPMLGSEDPMHSTAGGDPDAMFSTISGAELLATIGGGSLDVAAILRAAKPGQELSPEDAAVQSRTGPKVKKPHHSVLNNASEAERLSARLRHLCQLIARDRRPRCPVNGILLLLPIHSTDTDADANQAGLVCQRDLATVAETFRVRCPLMTLVCDVEKLGGFAEFLERFPAKQRHNRLGQSHPWIADVGRGELSQTIDAEVGWICQGLLAHWIYKLFKVDLARTDGVTDPIKGNADLFQFLCTMRERQMRLAKVINNFVRDPESENALLYGGCYLAGTGPTASEQAFVPGVIDKLIKSQDFVAWTPAAMEEDTRYHQWVVYGWLGLGAAVVGAGGLIYVLVRK